MRIPFVKCRGKCTDSCSMVACTAEEASKLGPKPEVRYDDDPCTCAWLDVDGRCSTYETRPLVCRLFGAVLSLRCPYGCRPRAWPSARDERYYMRDRIKGDIVILTAEGVVDAGRAREILESLP